MTDFSFNSNWLTRPQTRRQALATAANGFGGLAMASLLANPASARTHHPAKAKNVIFCFMDGGVSHVDSFDPKPKLAELDGKPCTDSKNVTANVNRTDGGSPRFDSALRESWEVSASLRRADGHWLASFNPYYQVLDPSRYHAPGVDRSMLRPIDLCYTDAARGRDRCAGLPATPITWDDERSPFKGVRRFVDVNGNFVSNADGPTVWYTDPLGRNGRTTPTPNPPHRNIAW